jgi:hypothetical protein
MLPHSPYSPDLPLWFSPVWAAKEHLRDQWFSAIKEVRKWCNLGCTVSQKSSSLLEYTSYPKGGPDVLQSKESRTIFWKVNMDGFSCRCLKK